MAYSIIFLSLASIRDWYLLPHISQQPLRSFLFLFFFYFFFFLVRHATDQPWKLYRPFLKVMWWCMLSINSLFKRFHERCYSVQIIHQVEVWMIVTALTIIIKSMTCSTYDIREKHTYSTTVTSVFWNVEAMKMMEKKTHCEHYIWILIFN